MDTVHQGDFNGQKGVYHINLVDSVLQWEIVICVEAISEDYMAAALEEALNGFPFVILSFHSDNGGEFINKLVADMLNKQLIKQTKSRSGRTNDNALVEGKNGSVIRKHMGHWYIDRCHAGEIHRFYMDCFNIYLNYHRPCGFATITEDEKGRRKRKYNTYRTPYTRLKALENAEQYLREGITFEDLDKIAMDKSDNDFARTMQEAKARLFRKVMIPKAAGIFKKGGVAVELRRTHAERFQPHL